MNRQELTEVGTSAFESPEQITVGIGIGIHNRSISQDDLKVLYIVCCKTIFARKMEEATSEYQPAYADLRNTSSDHTQLVWVQGLINLSPLLARSYASDFLVVTDTNRVQLL